MYMLYGYIMPYTCQHSFAYIPLYYAGHNPVHVYVCTSMGVDVCMCMLAVVDVMWWYSYVWYVGVEGWGGCSLHTINVT